ncbi:cephalosporin hydroxylase family protein [Sneathiella glossodoripedis]|uniref:cephalosporin hydroxylase family protein n=1 Tax=Sneathiella glossodoripedis TaxID=418853 RepID=UPI000562E494|nr:cephalosporin hydroxylase family protein [Sneathiella glossodoripedis]
MTNVDKDPIEAFRQEVVDTVSSYADEKEWRDLTHEWTKHALSKRYVYNFSSFGRPIIQFPTDMVAFQEIVWEVKPDLIIETGIAHGGSLIQSAALMANLDYCEAVQSNSVLDPSKSNRKVLGIDIDIRKHNRQEIEAHPFSHLIQMIEGSSVDSDIISEVRSVASEYQKILVCLDSNHTHEHVYEELKAYAPLTSKDSYCIVFDTVVEDMPDDFYPDRPWGPANSPKSAVYQYLDELEQSAHLGADGEKLLFENNQMIEDKLFFTVNPNGFLKRV